MSTARALAGRIREALDEIAQIVERAASLEAG